MDPVTETPPACNTPLPTEDTQADATRLFTYCQQDTEYFAEWAEMKTWGDEDWIHVYKSHLADPTVIPDFDAVRATVTADFPDLWPAVEASLATVATLLLAGTVNPATLILVGAPGGGKTTVCNLFTGHTLAHRSDGFTVASFVSQASNVDTKKLEKVDLLPKIRHRVLITPELASTFAGKEDEVRSRMSVLIRVLDGDGLTLDAGTHGQRGYTGDYLFSWLGGTTPLTPKVWAMMAQLGSRLFFHNVDGEDVDDQVGALLAQDEGPAYADKLARCRGAIHTFLTDLWTATGGIRSIRGDRKGDAPKARTNIARLAAMVAALRSIPASVNSAGEETAGSIERPARAYEVLSNLAQGSAVVHGRPYVTMDDLPVIARVAVGSVPANRGAVFVALAKKGSAAVLDTTEVTTLLGVSHVTAVDVMDQLAGLKVVTRARGGGSRPGTIQFSPQWDWAGSDPDFSSLF